MNAQGTYGVKDLILSAESYLDMMHVRLAIICDFLIDTDSLAVHCDWMGTAYFRAIRDKFLIIRNLIGTIAVGE